MAASFTPVDLRASGNVTRTNLADESGWVWAPTGDGPNDTVLDALPSGDCRFWGIPFDVVGPGETSAWVMVAGNGTDQVPERASAQIGQTARRILFAHVCAPVEGQRVSIDGAGETIATYRIVYADQTTVEQELRRRYEIHDVNIPWGHRPFLCRNCRHFLSLPEEGHPHGVTTEYGSPMSGWWLYDWQNPHADKVIERGRSHGRRSSRHGPGRRDTLRRGGGSAHVAAQG